MSNLRSGKKLPLFAALSVLVIIVGIVLYALFGFHYTTANVSSVEIRYDAIVTINEQEDELETFCEDTFSAQGLKVKEKRESLQRDLNSIGETGDKRIVYKFSANTTKDVLSRAASAIQSGAEGRFGDAEIYVTFHIEEDTRFYEAAWRGAIALAVAAIVALVYLGFRYGVACAVSGLCAVCNDALLTLALLAIVRIPVYPYVPLLFAGLAAVFTLILWVTQCAKLRACSKDPSFAALSAEEAVSESCRSSMKRMLALIGSFAGALIVLGAVASAGVRLFFLPALLPLAVSVYSSLLLAPAILIPLKSRIDRMKATKKRYAGKKKAETALEE